MKNAERIVNFALAGLTLASFFVKVDPNFNVVLTACLSVYLGCYRSVKQTPPTETMSSEDAMHFPFVGSAMLLSLFLLFKFLSKDLVNAVLTCYFFVMGIIALSETIVPAIKRFLPKYWNEHLILWRLSSQGLRSLLLFLEPFSVHGMLGRSFGWLIGPCFLHSGWTFCYDIFWVFFTSVVVSVAKSFDAPIKLLFSTADAAQPFSMLGIGNIVIPALRFDASRGKEASIFESAFLGYTTGLVLTIVVMNWSQAAQPALLYIVPAVIEFLAAHIVWNGEVKPLLEFDESRTTATSEENSDNKTSKKLE